MRGISPERLAPDDSEQAVDAPNEGGNERADSSIASPIPANPDQATNEVIQSIEDHDTHSTGLLGIWKHNTGLLVTKVPRKLRAATDIVARHPRIQDLRCERSRRPSNPRSRARAQRSENVGHVGFVPRCSPVPHPTSQTPLRLVAHARSDSGFAEELDNVSGNSDNEVESEHQDTNQARQNAEGDVQSDAQEDAEWDFEEDVEWDSNEDMEEDMEEVEEDDAGGRTEAIVDESPSSSGNRSQTPMQQSDEENDSEARIRRSRQSCYRRGLNRRRSRSPPSRGAAAKHLIEARKALTERLKSAHSNQPKEERNSRREHRSRRHRMLLAQKHPCDSQTIDFARLSKEGKDNDFLRWLKAKTDAAKSVYRRHNDIVVWIAQTTPHNPNGSDENLLDNGQSQRSSSTVTSWPSVLPEKPSWRKPPPRSFTTRLGRRLRAIIPRGRVRIPRSTNEAELSEGRSRRRRAIGRLIARGRASILPGANETEPSAEQSSAEKQPAERPRRRDAVRRFINRAITTLPGLHLAQGVLSRTPTPALYTNRVEQEDLRPLIPSYARPIQAIQSPNTQSTIIQSSTTQSLATQSPVTQSLFTNYPSTQSPTFQSATHHSLLNPQNYTVRHVPGVGPQDIHPAFRPEGAFSPSPAVNPVSQGAYPPPQRSERHWAEVYPYDTIPEFYARRTRSLSSITDLGSLATPPSSQTGEAQPSSSRRGVPKRHGTLPARRARRVRPTLRDVPEQPSKESLGPVMAATDKALASLAKADHGIMNENVNEVQHPQRQETGEEPSRQSRDPEGARESVTFDGTTVSNRGSVMTSGTIVIGIEPATLCSAQHLQRQQSGEESL